MRPRFFAGLTLDERDEVLAEATTQKIGARQIIFREGDPPAALFLLKAGRAKFYRLTPQGDEVMLSPVTPGEIFGLGTLVANPVPYIGTAEAMQDSELLVWEQARIRKLARKYPRLAENALEAVLRYLAAHMDRLVHLVTATASERLARAVLHLGSETGKVVATGVEIEATNEDLGALANVSSFTASRLLNQWARSGALSKSRGKLFIYTPEKLLVE